MSLHRRFVENALSHPRRACMADSTGAALTYREVLLRAMVIRAFLEKHGGDEKMLGIVMPSIVAGGLANIATHLHGRVPVNLNFTAGPAAIESAVKQCGIRQVLTSRKFLKRLEIDPPAEPLWMEDIADESSLWTKLAAFFKVAALPRKMALSTILADSDRADGDLACVLFSSGSTGEPKGVMLSHGNLLSNISAAVQALGLKSTDRMLGTLPLFHSFGFVVTLWLPLVSGMGAAYHPNPLDAKRIGKLCREQNCTVFPSAPTFLRRLAHAVDPKDLASLRLVVTGAEKLPADLAREFQERFGLPLLEGYGCTELSPIVSANLPDEVVDGKLVVRNRPGTVGTLLPGVRVKVLDPDTGEQRPRGEAGELWVSGPNVMMGYLGHEELTADSIREGWYRTGDIALLEDDGFLRITDRRARFSKIAGEMVPHGLVEEALQEIVGATEPIFAVCGVPDPRKGERLVVLHAAVDRPPDALCLALQKKGIPNLWIPSTNCFFAVDAIPLLASGKVDLQKVKQMALALAG